MQNLTRKVVHTYRASLMKACCNHIPHESSLMKPQVSDHQSPWNLDAAASDHQSPWKTFGNPCLDMFHYLFPWIKSSAMNPSYDNCNYHLNRLLPLAWSYNPITTLKIIHTLSPGGTNGAPMSDALYWIHQNHPKTLAANLIPLVLKGSLGHDLFTTILYRILDLKDTRGPSEEQEHVKEINEAIKAGNTNKGIPEPLRILSNRIVYMYERDLNFRYLHDEIAHLFAESLKFDIQNFLEKVDDYDCDRDPPLEVTEAAEYCDGSPFLLESVASILYPHVKDVEAAVELLRNDVLAPLKKVLCRDATDGRSSPRVNIYGYSNEHNKNEPDPIRKQRRPVLDKYLKDLSEYPDKMVPDALLPHELVEYVTGKNNGNISRHVVELQWKAMVEDLKKRQLRVLKNSLAVIKRSNAMHFSELTGAMTILISELNEEEAWKGKVISMTPNPQLLSIQGHDLSSKCEFLRDPAKMLYPDCPEYFDCKKVLDLILQHAVSESLKQEQIIKKVFVFPFWDEFEDVSFWEVKDYDDMRNKYREHGYDMPQIVFWRPCDHRHTPFTDSPDERGISAISGFQRARGRDTSGGVNYIKMFLENDGNMSPQRVMESVLCDKDYRYPHNFVVLD